MKLKNKLILALVITFIVPVLLYTTITQLMAFSQIHRLNKDFDLNIKYIQYMTGIYEETICEVTRDERIELMETAATDPAQMTDATYLKSVEASLKKHQSYLTVVADGAVCYGEADGKLLQFFDTVQTDSVDSSWYRKESLIVRGVGFTQPDGTKGVCYIITNIHPYTERYWSSLSSEVFFLMLVEALVMLLIGVWFFRSLYKPFDELRGYTRRIAEGNLDGAIVSRTNDEIGDLYHDFEVMRKKLQESATRQISDDAEGKVLISNISHDLKTPITSIKGYVEGIMDGVADTPEKQERYIRTIYNKACDMDRLIDELTYYSRINTNKIPYTFAKIDISDYFEDCIGEIAADLDAEGVEFKSENVFEGVSVPVIADPEQLKKVINNIVSNAVKYMNKEQPKIWMRLLSYEEGAVTVEIEDNGKGISKEDQSRIFERFYRTDSARSSSTGGSGIGLSICRKFIDDHGGTIGVESVEGLGTTMRFSLKIHKGDEQ